MQTARQSAERQLVIAHEVEANTSAKLSNANARIANLESENTRINTALTTAEAANDQLSVDVVKAQRDLNEQCTVNIEAQTALKASQQDNTQLRATVQELQEDLKEERDGHDKTKAAHEGTTQELADANAQADGLHNKIAILCSSLDASEADNKRLSGKFDAECAAHAGTQGTLEETTSQLSVANGHITLLKEENAICQSSLKASQADNERLSGELKVESDAHASTKGVLETTWSQLSDANAEIATLTVANATCQSSLDDSERHNEELSDELDVARGAHGYTQQMLSAANAQIVDLEHGNGELQSELQAAQDGSQQLQARLDAECSAHRDTRATLSRAEGRIGELEGTCASVEGTWHIQC